MLSPRRRHLGNVRMDVSQWSHLATCRLFPHWVGVARVDPYWLLRTAGGFVATGPAAKTLISRDGAAWTAKPSAIHPDSANEGSWDARDAAGSGSTVVMVGSYAQSDGSTLVEYGGLVWTGAPF